MGTYSNRDYKFFLSNPRERNSKKLYINLKDLTSLSTSDTYVISGSVQNAYQFKIDHYVKPRTAAQDMEMIGVMIQSEINSGIKPRFDEISVGIRYLSHICFFCGFSLRSTIYPFC